MRVSPMAETEGRFGGVFRRGDRMGTGLAVDLRTIHCRAMV